MVDLSTLGIGGIGTEGFFAVLIYLIYKDFIRPKYISWKNGRIEDNPGLGTGIGCRPGYGTTCKEHGKDIGQIEKDFKLISRDVNRLIAKSEENCKHNDQEHVRMFKLIDRLRNGVK